MRRTWLVYGCWVLLAGLVGAGWGFLRGLSYLPTLWAAPIEGGIVFAVPAAVVGLPFVGLSLLALWLRRRVRAAAVQRNSERSQPRG